MLLNPQIESIYPRLNITYNVLSTKLRKSNSESENEVLSENVNFEHVKYIQSLSTGKEILQDTYLTGRNITIGIGDSSLDITHCMFIDEDNTNIEYNTTIQHRKLVSYVNFTDVFENQKYYFYIIL